MTEIVVEIERLGRSGDGLVETDAHGRLAVPGALPGEQARVDVSVDPPVLLQVLTAAPSRVSPLCPYAAQCGGCAMQHLAPEAIATWRVEQIGCALARQGLEAEIAPPISSPPRSRRRVGFAATRTKKGVLLGFHRRRTHDVVDIDACLVARPEIIDAVPALKSLARLAAPRKREIKILGTVSEGGLDLALEGAKELTAELRQASVDWLRETEDAGRSIARLVWDGEPVATLRPPAQTFGRARVIPPPGAFLQATEAGEAALISAVRAGVADARRVADLFSGCGTFALPLAEQAEVLAVDADAAAISALDRGWREAPGLRKVAAVARDLFRRPMRAAELKGVEAVVFDPPRAGAEDQAREIAAASVPRVVGVSCNPATFARDARILADGGLRLAGVTPVDQFLWSAHLEMVGVFER